MPTLLHIDSSPLDSSISRELTATFVEAWKAANPSGTVVRRNLSEKPAPPIDQAWIYAAYTPEEQQTSEQKQLLALSEELIDEIKAADEIVIGVAMHNFGVPAVLKLWIDQIARRGKTFVYDANGAKGLLTVKKATVLISTGGNYSQAPMAAMNFVEPYLVSVLGFLGITDVRALTASGASQVMMGTVTREAFIEPLTAQVKTLVA
ncbi:MAG: NAD(P)H-dependent oxidoreductase [Edaphobacter sp.]|uniref:FMN-dependent NADH-azoreductase n=1 Tax=Edaphobacter sp. TaxID=1934404 RepID=UPI0023A062AB|nr:NAD(P)H-dependent oxidoreductase [Edaphobacter sp.]MDE1178551.1 NAD(P)H-dependent oxidoreductase [Edaphobacter sp.]